MAVSLKITECNFEYAITLIVVVNIIMRKLINLLRGRTVQFN